MSWIWRRHCGDGHGRLSAYAHRTLQAITFSAGSDVAVSSVGGAEFRSAITSHMRMCHRYELLEADVPSVVDHSFEPVGLPAFPKVTHEKHVHFLFFPLSPPHVRPPNADVEAVVDDFLELVRLAGFVELYQKSAHVLRLIFLLLPAGTTCRKRTSRRWWTTVCSWWGWRASSGAARTRCRAASGSGWQWRAPLHRCKRF